MTDTFVVVGGDAAGMSAASKGKREAPEMEVVAFERGEWVSYGACGLPYYVKGDVDSLEDLVAVAPEEFREERDVDLRTGHEVTAVDTDARTVTVEPNAAAGGDAATDGGDAVGDGDAAGGNGDSFEQPYDHLLVATGAGAVVPPIDGVDRDGVFTFQTVGAGGAVKEFVESESPAVAGVVGGGYVGLEMAEAFDARGLEVHVFEMLPHVLQPFGADVAEVVEDHLRERGVHLHLNTPVEAIEGEGGRVTGIRTEDSESGETTTVPVDLALVGVGVGPRVDLLEDTAVELGPTGAVATDEYGRTNVADVYAAGDCAEVRNAVTGDPDFVPLALTANRHGRAVGATVAGDPTPVGPVVGSAEVKVFDLEVARTGVVDEEEAREAGFDPVSRTIEEGSRAHYYPGGSPITIEMVGDRGTGRLLGASMVGREGVAQRINTVAAALHSETTVVEFERHDFAYAPPFSPPWDPVLTAAKVLNGALGDAGSEE